MGFPHARCLRFVLRKRTLYLEVGQKQMYIPLKHASYHIDRALLKDRFPRKTAFAWVLHKGYIQKPSALHKGIHESKGAALCGHVRKRASFGGCSMFAGGRPLRSETRQKRDPPPSLAAMVAKLLGSMVTKPGVCPQMCGGHFQKPGKSFVLP